MKRILIKYHDKENNTLNAYDLDMNFDPDMISKTMIPDTKLTSNDRHSSYSISGSLLVNGIMYKIENPSNIEISERKIKIVTESYFAHLDKLKHLPESNYRWIYNIIDGNAEHAGIIHQTSEYILMRDYVWDTSESNTNIDEMHILGIIRDKRLKSIREIEQQDIPMLIRIKEDAILKIYETYNICEENIKIYFHYTPSTYQLHIHFVNIKKCNYKTSVEVCNRFDDVIKNISIDPDYYHGDMKIITYY